ncbi:MAG TPA: VIT1/CCC1 transporter family protein [Candidatus Binataceae bacterium]|nr:VIT1/CCC1 transporter family protein [Candidatus Binataceae bacterium]
MAIGIRKREFEHHTEQVHAAGGNWVRDLMLGLNDGLVASFAVTSGVAGAFTAQRVVVMAGLAEMLGGAVSMALAAFISARSQIEFYLSEIEREREEIRKWPDREREEISTIYRAKGFAGKLLDQIVAHITADPERWSDVMMREELGFSSESFDRPLRSGLTVGLAYLSGAAVPLAPYVFLAPREGIVASALATILVLFGVGAAKTRITNRQWWRSGLESMLTGIAAATVTYAAGRLFASR